MSIHGPSDYLEQTIEMFAGRIAFNEDLQQIFNDDSDESDIREYLLEVAPSLYTLHNNLDFQDFINQFIKGIEAELIVMREFQNDLLYLKRVLNNPKQSFHYLPESSFPENLEESPFHFDNTLELAIHLHHTAKMQHVASEERDKYYVNLLFESKEKILKEKKKDKKFVSEFKRSTKKLSENFRALFSEVSLYSSLNNTLSQLIREESGFFKKFNNKIQYTFHPLHNQTSVGYSGETQLNAIFEQYAAYLKHYRYILDNKLNSSTNHMLIQQDINKMIRTAQAINLPRLTGEDIYNPTFIVNIWRYEQILERIRAKISLETQPLEQLQRRHKEIVLAVERAKQAKMDEAKKAAKQAKKDFKAKALRTTAAKTATTSSAVRESIDDVKDDPAASSSSDTSESRFVDPASEEDEVATGNKGEMTSQPQSSAASESAPTPATTLANEATEAKCLASDDIETRDIDKPSQALPSAVSEDSKTEEMPEDTSLNNHSLLFSSANHPYKRKAKTKEESHTPNPQFSQIECTLRKQKEKFCQLFSKTLKKQYTIAELDNFIQLAGGHVDHSKAGSRKKVTLFSQTSDMLASQPQEIRETLHHPHAKRSLSEKHASVTTVKLYRSIFQRANITPENIWPQDFSQNITSKPARFQL